MKLENNNLLQNIYYSKEYISLYVKENEEIFEFEYKQHEKIFYNIAIKKPIQKIGNIKINDGYFDLETAYGYGGFYTNCNDEEFLLSALEKYILKCVNEKIIAEFIRFHPFNNFPLLHNDYFNMNFHDRDTVLINLNQNYTDIRSEYSSSLKRNINKAIKEKLIFNRENINENMIKQFYEMYYTTMQKNNANEFYFFDLKYFDQLFSLQATELYSASFNDEIICMIVIFNSQETLYYHLGATNKQFYNLNPNPFVFDHIIQNNYCKANFLFLGGGTSSDLNDSLFKFKQKFSPLTKPFYIAGKIYNNEIYQKYNALWESQTTSDVKYFLKYRLEMQ